MIFSLTAKQAIWKTTLAEGANTRTLLSMDKGHVVLNRMGDSKPAKPGYLTGIYGLQQSIFDVPYGKRLAHAKSVIVPYVDSGESPGDGG